MKPKSLLVVLNLISRVNEPIFILFHNVALLWCVCFGWELDCGSCVISIHGAYKNISGRETRSAFRCGSVTLDCISCMISPFRIFYMVYYVSSDSSLEYSRIRLGYYLLLDGDERWNK